MMRTKTTFFLAISMMGFLLAGPASGQTAPGLPSMEAILEAREPLVRPDLQAKIAALEGQLSETSSFRNLVIDRVTLKAGAHRGLTLLSATENGSDAVTHTINDKTDYFWRVSYEIGLSELFKPRASRAKRQTALEAAEAELDQAVIADRLEMLARINQYLEARAKLQESAGGALQTAEAAAAGLDLSAGYTMREQAMAILVLVGMEDEPLFEQWDRFLPEEAEPQVTTLARR